MFVMLITETDRLLLHREHIIRVAIGNSAGTLYFDVTGTEGRNDKFVKVVQSKVEAALRHVQNALNEKEIDIDLRPFQRQDVVEPTHLTPADPEVKG